MFANIILGHRINQWRCLLFCTSSKIKLVQFMVEDWKRSHLKEKLEGKVLYATCGDNCFKLTAKRLDEVNELNKVQAETDTRMLLHAAADYDSIMIVAVDTDVLMFSMVVQARIDCNIYTYGTRARTRNLMPIKYVPLLHCSVGNAHIYIVCDTASAFSGIGPETAHSEYNIPGYIHTILGSAVCQFVM